MHSMWHVNKFKMMLAVFAGGIIGSLIYFPLAHSHWSTACGILGFCAGYTVTVFGLAWSIEDFAFVAENPKPTRTILLVHMVIVALIAEIVNFGLYVGPSLPAWLSEPLSWSSSGRAGKSGFDLIEMATLGIILMAEAFWLRRNMPKLGQGSDPTTE